VGKIDEQLFDRAAFEAPHEVEAARRAVIQVDVTCIADSCGYGVMSYEGERPHMDSSRRARWPRPDRRKEKRWRRW
jgi:hypothetical protein